MRKRMILLSAITFLAIIFFIVFYGNEPREINENVIINMSETSDIELFIRKYLLTEEGWLRTNFSEKKDGDLALSESLGLWMEYLVAKGDMSQFEDAFQTMQRTFQLPNHLLSWQIKAGDKAQTNALIDDLRVIEALFQMGELTNNREYIDEAVKMSEAIKTHHLYEGYFVDFYDVEHEKNNDFTTISYVNTNALVFMEKYKVLKPKVVKRMIDFLAQLPVEDVFYPQTYYLTENRYEFEEEINLIDQLYIGLHMEQADITTDTLFQWVQEEFSKEDKLYGRYDAKTKKHTVTYESVAVYSLAILYGLERGETKFSKDVYDAMMLLQVQDEEDPAFGGFVANNGATTHSFDNLLAGLAERKLKHAKLIP